MKALGLIIALFCLSSVFTQSPDMVVEIFRHGIRSPEAHEFDPSWEKIGYGELTNAGIRQQYVLGAALKELYPNLLLPYSPAKIFVQSTQENRTIMSALSQLYGVYYQEGPNLGDGYPAEVAVPPYNSDEVKKILNDLTGVDAAIPDHYFPLPVHSILKKGDNLLQSYLNCPNADKFYFSQKNDTKVQQTYAKLAETIKNLEKLGLNIHNVDDLDDLGDTIIADSANHVPLPGGLDPTTQDYKDVVFWALWYEIYPTLNMPLQRQLFSGPLMNNVLNLFQQKRNGTTDLSFSFYAAKESLLASLLSAFGIMTPECLLENWEAQKAQKPIPHLQCNYPMYASNLIFEYFNTAAPYVVFKYNGNVMKICDGKDSCTLDEFTAKIQQITGGYDLAKFQQWCGTAPQVTKESGTPEKGSFDVILIVIAVALAVVLVGLHIRNKKAKEAVYTSPALYRDLEVV